MKWRPKSDDSIIRDTNYKFREFGIPSDTVDGSRMAVQHADRCVLFVYVIDVHFSI